MLPPLPIAYKKEYGSILRDRTFKEREAYRKEFIGNIAHELKTPLVYYPRIHLNATGWSS